MTSIRIVIAGIAVPGNKKRTRRYADRDTGEWRTMAYNPAHVAKWQQTVRLHAQEAMADLVPLDTSAEGRKQPLSLSLAVILPVPGSFSHKAHLLALAGHIRPAKRPDLDNYVKAICDSLLGVVFFDDAAIVEYLPPFGKWYGEKPRVEIVISRLEPISEAAELPLFQS